MKKYKDFGVYDFSDYAEEVTGDALFKINGGAEVENSHEGVAGANVGDTLTRKDGTVVVINQGDINYAKRQLGIDETSSSDNSPIENYENNGSNVDKSSYFYNKNEDTDSVPINVQSNSHSFTYYEEERKKITQNEKNQKSSQVIYKSIDSSKWAPIPIEGVGVNGKSNFRTYALMENNNSIEVDVLGTFIAKKLVDSSNFFGIATLVVDGNKIETKPYKIETGNFIWDGRYDRIGTVKFNYDYSNAKSIQVISDVDLIIGSNGLGKTIVNYNPTHLELR